MKRKSSVLWMVIDQDYVLRSQGPTRQAAIREWCAKCGGAEADTKKKWASDRKRGFCCIKADAKESSE